MAAGTWTLTNTGRTNLLNGTFDIDSDTWKMTLHSSSSDVSAATTTIPSGQLSTANGYTSGGQTVTLALSGTTSVTVTLSAPVVWTAAGGSIAARYAVLTESGGNVLAYVLLDSAPADVTATTGNTLTVSNSTPIFTLA